MPVVPPELVIQLFGPPRTLVRGEPLPRLRARSIEWLLALLVLRHGRTVDRPWLAGTLWPDSEESQALHNLRNALVHLRKALGPEGGCLQSPSRDTLTLDLEGAEVDVLQFDAAIKSGDEIGLQRAVSLYTGPLLEGCYEVWAIPERERRELECLTALETLADRGQEREDYEEAIRYLRRAEALDPLRDSIARRLMTCLAAAGDPAAAIEVYRNLRTRLHEELVAKPDPATTALLDRIRATTREQGTRQRPSASLSPPEQVHEGVYSARSPLPAPLTPLIGRDEQVEEILALLRQNRLVTLIGGGGVGKTRLALEAAALASEDRAGGAVWVELAPVVDGAHVLFSVAAALGMREEGARDDTEALLSQLANRLSGLDPLLVLDNCEHLIDAVAQQVQKLLQRCAPLHILATSRRRLGLTGEIVWRVPSLPVPEPEAILDLSDPNRKSKIENPKFQDVVLSYPAVQLFVERAAAARTGFALAGHDDVAAVCRICSRLDGIPLALELAAARVRSLTPRQIVERLDDRFGLLTTGSRGVLPRHQTLRALIDWSYDQLQPDEAALLRRLSVFPGGWTLDAAEAVCDGFGDVLDVLDSLVDHSLVQVEERDGALRYRMLETIREYSLERLRERDEETAERNRHLAYYVRLAKQIGQAWIFGDPLEALDTVDTEMDNYRGALAWAQGPRGDEKAFLQIAAALWPYWEMRGSLSEGREVLHTALKIPAPSDSPERARVLLGAATFAFIQAELGKAIELGEESLQAFRHLDDPPGLVGALLLSGHALLEDSAFSEAEAYLNEALEQSRACDWRRGIALAMTYLGLLEVKREEWSRADPLLDQGVAAADAVGHAPTLAVALLSRGYMALATRDHGGAIPLLERSLDLWRRLGHTHHASLTLRHLGLAARGQGDHTRAAVYLADCAARLREQGHRQHLAIALHELGNVQYQQRDYEHARESFSECIDLLLQVGSVWRIDVARNSLGSTLFHLGKPDQALEQHQLALKRYRQKQESEGIVYSLERIVTLEAQYGEAQRAARWLGSASAARESLPRPLAPWDTEDEDAPVAAVRSRLEEADFQKAWEEGRTLSLEYAAEQAQGSEDR